MKRLILVLLLCAVAVSAAEVQIVVRTDTGVVVVNTTITTTNDVLNTIEAWRLEHQESYPDRASLFRAFVVEQAKRILRAKPTAAIEAERQKIEDAENAETAIIEGALVEP